jgi:ketosteroid isomerase-like protein
MTHTHAESEFVAARLRAAMESQDLEAYGALLDENVRWGPPEETPETCHSRAQVLQRLSSQRASGMQTQLLEVVPGDGTLLVGVNVKWPVPGGFAREQTRYQVLKVQSSKIVEIRGYADRAEAAAEAGLAAKPADRVDAQQPAHHHH